MRLLDGRWSGRISLALDEAQPGTVKTIDCGVLITRLKRTSELVRPTS